MIGVHGVGHVFLQATAALPHSPPGPLARDRARVRALGPDGQFWVREGSPQFQPKSRRAAKN